MSFQFTVSPDFTPDHISGWYIFNTWLQHQTNSAIHLEMYNDFHDQREAIKVDNVDLIYANPFDAAMLVREKGFKPLVKPVGESDEAIVAVHADNHVEDVAHLQEGVRVAVTEDPDVHMMGMIMLEPADLNVTNVEITPCDSYVLVAKQLLRGTSDVGFFLEEAHHDLSAMVRDQMRTLVTSQIQIIQHVLLVGPALANRRDELLHVLESMTSEEKGQGVLESMGIQGWGKLEQEDVEFMIDLMSTLVE